MRRLIPLGLLVVAAAAEAQSKGSVSSVTVAAPTVSNVSSSSPKASAVTTAKVNVAAATIAQPTVSKLSEAKPSVAAVNVSKVGFAGGGGGAAGGAGSDPLAGLTDGEKAIVEQGTKGDLDWSSGVEDGKATVNAASKAENDAATKTYQAAIDAGMDRAEAQKLAQAARKEVFTGPPPPPPPAAPATPAPDPSLPEVIDMSQPKNAGP
jgi:hypothetical protein